MAAMQGSAGLGEEGSAGLGEEGSAGLGEEGSAGLGEEGSAGLGEEGSAGLGGGSSLGLEKRPWGLVRTVPNVLPWLTWAFLWSSLPFSLQIIFVTPESTTFFQIQFPRVRFRSTYLTCSS